MTIETIEAVEKTLALINPETDTIVLSFYNEAVELQKFAESRVISTIEDTKLATNDLSIISKLKKAMEEKRQEYIKPLQLKVKEFNDAFKSLMLPVEEADRITRGKVLDYQKEQERIRQEQEEINRLKMEAAKKEMELNGELSEEIDLVEVQPKTPVRVHAEMGTAGQRMIKKWELVDITLVPEEYKTLDFPKITRVVKAGISSIQGIRIYEEAILAVNAR